MADEQEKSVSKADSDGDEPKKERTAEEIGEELLARMDQIDADIAELKGERGKHHDRLSSLEGATTGYAAAQHEHAYAGAEHKHDQGTEGSGHEEGERREKAPRAEHFWYRKFREKR